MVTDMMFFIEMTSNYKFVQCDVDSSMCIVREEIIPFVENDCDYN